MEEIWNDIVGFVGSDRMLAVGKALATAIVGTVIARWAARLLARSLSRRLDPSQQLLVRRLTFYTLVVLTMISALGQLEVDLTVLLGAAGVLTVAVGFASQTSASNLISGGFLLAERPFVMGDLIRVGSNEGVVRSIDLLSVKMQTVDNLYVRIPNETLLKSDIINLTHYPIRRLDFVLGVAYDSDMPKVREVLLAVAHANRRCLDEPVASVRWLDFADSALTLRFAVWAHADSVVGLRDTFREEIKAAFDAAGIAIPFPQRTVHMAPTTREASGGVGTPPA